MFPPYSLGGGGGWEETEQSFCQCLGATILFLDNQEAKELHEQPKEWNNKTVQEYCRLRALQSRENKPRRKTESFYFASEHSAKFVANQVHSSFDV